MELKIFGMSCRLEIIILAIVVGTILGGHLLCSCSRIGVQEGMAVMQEVEDLNAGLSDTIKAVAEELDVKPSILKKAIKTAQLEEVIQKLPQGINTRVGEKGYKLSGGERQRVGIARALLNERKIEEAKDYVWALDDSDYSVKYYTGIILILYFGIVFFSGLMFKTQIII